MLDGILNSLCPSEAIQQHRSWSTFIQVMACRLSSTKPLPEPMLTYCQLNQPEPNLVKFEIKTKIFHGEKRISKYHLNGLDQDCSNSSALAMELLQSCTKQSICKMLTILFRPQCINLFSQGEEGGHHGPQRRMLMKTQRTYSSMC